MQLGHFPGQRSRKNFRSWLGGGDRFDDWVVGRQFVPHVSDTTPNRVFLRGFSATDLRDFGLCGRSSILVRTFGALSLHPKSPFPAAKPWARSQPLCASKSDHSVIRGPWAGRALRLFRIESERLKLSAPFCRRIAKPLDAEHAADMPRSTKITHSGCPTVNGKWTAWRRAGHRRIAKSKTKTRADGRAPFGDARRHRHIGLDCYSEREGEHGVPELRKRQSGWQPILRGLWIAAAAVLSRLRPRESEWQ